MRIRHLLFVPFLLLASCSSDHPLTGNWAQDTGTAVKGIQLGFDTAGTKVTVHTAPRPDGTHDHPAATYTFDAASKAVTIKGDLAGDGKTDTWTGTVTGDTMQLTGGAATLRFKKGGSAH